LDFKQTLKHLFYTLYKRNGKEKSKKIKKANVAFTLTFDKQVKQEKYPLRMDVQDFYSLPIYFPAGKSWATCVFGTNNMSNLSYLKKEHQDIYEYYVKGKAKMNTAVGISTVGLVLTCIGLIPVGLVFSLVSMPISLSGQSNMGKAFNTFSSTCVDLEVCAKYGIIITPYNSNPFTIQAK